VKPLHFGLLLLLIVCVLALPALTTQSPRVIVNIPADSKPLQSLPDDKVVSGDKAVLWWTVYKATLDKGWSSDAATIAAERAIKSVYSK